MKTLITIKKTSRKPFLAVAKKKQRKAAHLAGLKEAFNDVKLHLEGKIVLKSFEELLNEL